MARKNKVKVVMPLGNVAIKLLGIDGKIGKVRGSVYEVRNLIAVPSYHPSFILRGMWKEEPTWFNDFLKARELSLKKWKKIKENFNIEPSVEEIEKFTELVVSEGKTVAVDIETTSLNEYYSKIIMIGFARDGENALVVPFLKQGGSSYWRLHEEIKVRNCVMKILREVPLMFQNALFDTLHLEQHGYKCGFVKEDTMLLHHCISPELPHNIGYIVSVYGKTPYWKDTVLGAASKMVELDQTEVRTYNARDTVTLHQVLPDMLKHIRSIGTEKVYREVSMPLVPVLRRMTQNGLPLDRKKLTALGRQFKKATEKYDKELRALCDLPELFNFDSGDHLRMLIYGEEPKGMKKIREQLVEYDLNPKLKKTTKKYKTLVDRAGVIMRTLPLYQTSGKRGQRAAVSEQRTRKRCL
ncbi:MAG: hypothetical protein HC888_02650 [Candidatus Competibacteraceae bacterium]|nr:hypothetical protein [Candidatus Competibacteraceae bacterium]